MVSLQILNKIISTGDLSIIEKNGLTRDYFVKYQDEFDFIMNHYTKYGNVPNVETFLANFTDFELIEVTETDRYLIDTIKEEYLYYISVPIVKEAAKLLKKDAFVASEYMIQAVKQVQTLSNTEGVDIIATADERLEKYKERKDHQEDFYFTTGFKELDDMIHGISREVELCVLFARTNQGKSWVLAKICTHIWQMGFNVGYVSPEMSADSVGYRFDTLNKKFSNNALMWGKKLNEEKYEKYIRRLKKNDQKFIVAAPTDFQGDMTVGKLRSFITANDLHVLAIDGITYMSDERYRRGDSTNRSLTNIAEDLRSLSLDLGVPILVVVQSNRTGVKAQDEEGTPELESIRDSDGISHNATKVLALRQVEGGVLEIGVKKNTFGMVGGKVKYSWDIDKGDFQLYDVDGLTDEEPRKPKTKEDVF